MTVSPLDPRAPYEQVADALRLEIAEKKLKPGDRLPSIRQLAERFQVAAGTIQSALRELKAEGLIVSQQAKGTYVRSDVSGVWPPSDNPRTKAELDRIKALAAKLKGVGEWEAVGLAELAEMARAADEMHSRSVRLAALLALEAGSEKPTES
ncbi:MAG TPA: winged helix-turn-helix domain-containing protein [Actinospica sp.]|nr:winged helix-turn-helix domain-containing protein [Actinospica sp.]